MRRVRSDEFANVMPILVNHVCIVREFGAARGTPDQGPDGVWAGVSGGATIGLQEMAPMQRRNQAAPLRPAGFSSHSGAVFFPGMATVSRARESTSRHLKVTVSLGGGG